MEREKTKENNGERKKEREKMEKMDFQTAEGCEAASIKREHSWKVEIGKGAEKKARGGGDDRFDRFVLSR